MSKAGSIDRRHYAVLDTFRFLAASGVVFYHFENHFQPFLAAPTSYLEEFQHFVDFFFVLSGFVLMHTYGGRVKTLADYGGFLRRRFARLYPLHLATILVLCVIGAAVAAVGFRVKDPSLFDFSLIPSNLLLIQAWGVNDHMGLNSPSWSLSAEFFVYLLFPLLAILLRKVGAVWTLLTAVMLTIVIETVRASLGLRPGDLATFDFGTLRALPAFLAGMATQAVVASIPPRPMRWRVPIAFGLLVLALMLFKAPSYLTISLFPVLVGLIAMAERGGEKTILAAPFFVLLGNASYAIYITHTFFEIAAVSLVRKLGWTTPLGLIVVALAIYVVIVAAGVVSYLRFETPMRKLLNGRRPGSAQANRTGPVAAKAS